MSDLPSIVDARTPAEPRPAKPKRGVWLARANLKPMKRISAAAALALALAAPAHALEQHDVFRQITSDVTCAADHCTTLIGWRGLVAQKCNRFHAPDATSDQQAVNECSNAEFGLMSALIKANSYGWGWFTDHSEPA